MRVTSCSLQRGCGKREAREGEGRALAIAAGKGVLDIWGRDRTAHSWRCKPSVHWYSAPAGVAGVAAAVAASHLGVALVVNDHRPLEQRADGFAGLRTNRQPLLDGRCIQVGLLVQRVVPAQELKRLAISPHARVDCNDPVEGQLLATDAGEPDLQA